MKIIKETKDKVQIIYNFSKDVVNNSKDAEGGEFLRS